jgi:hypothetical protein
VHTGEGVTRKGAHRWRSHSEGCVPMEESLGRMCTGGDTDARRRVGPRPRGQWCDSLAVRARCVLAIAKLEIKQTSSRFCSRAAVVVSTTNNAGIRLVSDWYPTGIRVPRGANPGREALWGALPAPPLAKSVVGIRVSASF